MSLGHNAFISRTNSFFAFKLLVNQDLHEWNGHLFRQIPLSLHPGRAGPAHLVGNRPDATPLFLEVCDTAPHVAAGTVPVRRLGLVERLCVGGQTSHAFGAQ